MARAKKGKKGKKGEKGKAMTRVIIGSAGAAFRGFEAGISAGVKSAGARIQAKQAAHKKKFITRKPKMEIITVVTRRAQPQSAQDIMITVPVLKEQHMGGIVSSSWIASIAWSRKRGHAIMALLNNYVYDVFISFKVFRAWNQAHSKGTFFNKRIKGRYKVKRVF